MRSTSPARLPAVRPAAPAEMDVEERLRRAERFGHSLEGLLQGHGQAHHAPEAQPAGPAPEPRAAAPIQARFDWKKKLVTAVGVLGGAAALTAGAMTGGTALAVGGGLSMLAGGVYGAYQHRRDRQEREAEYQRQQGQAMPNNMHFIWLGGELPEQRRRNILEWQRSAGGVTPHLWLDENSAHASRAHLRELEDAGVQIRRVGELEAGSRRFQQARRNLPTVDAGGVNRPVTGALSDIARLEILRQEGGHYMDSDNAPGRDAARFANMRGPLGFRLGWGTLGRSPNFSNDAMSANPGNRYIGSYLDQSYRNLTPSAMTDIRSRSDAATRAVMATTGPEAMRSVPFPISSDREARVRSEATEVRRRGGETVIPRGPLAIDLFPGNLEYGQSRLHPEGMFSREVGDLHGDIAYSGTQFVRGLGNSWIDRGKDEKKKTQ